MMGHLVSLINTVSGMYQAGMHKLSRMQLYSCSSKERLCIQEKNLAVVDWKIRAQLENTRPTEHATISSVHGPK